MPEIQVPELARKLARRFGIDGPAPASSLAPEIVPVTLVDDLTVPTIEDTGFERYCAGYVGPGPTAANYSHCQLFNPAASSTMIIVAGLIVSRIATAGGVFVRYYDTSLPDGAGVQSFIDRRLTGSPVGATRWEDHTAIRGTAFTSLYLPASEAVYYPIETILAPGQGLVLVPADVNIALVTNFFWVERSSMPGE